jgi:hypothetical protein
VLVGVVDSWIVIRSSGIGYLWLARWHVGTLVRPFLRLGGRRVTFCKRLLRGGGEEEGRRAKHEGHEGREGRSLKDDRCTTKLPLSVTNVTDTADGHV